MFTCVLFKSHSGTTLVALLCNENVHGQAGTLYFDHVSEIVEAADTVNDLLKTAEDHLNILMQTLLQSNYTKSFEPHLLELEFSMTLLFTDNYVRLPQGSHKIMRFHGLPTITCILPYQSYTRWLLIGYVSQVQYRHCQSRT